MTSQVDLLSLSQQEIEKAFAAVVHEYPVHAVKQCGWLDASLIIDERVKKYWSTMKELVDTTLDDDTADVISTKIALENDLMDGILSWLTRNSFGASAEAYAQEISDRASMMVVGSSLGELWKKLQRNDRLGVKETITNLFENMQSGTPSELPNLDTIHDRFVQLANDGQRSVKTGILPIDNALGGLERQTLVVLAARPSMGKTAMGLQIARNVAAAGRDVIFFSLEMSAVSLWSRVACPLAGVQWREVLADSLGNEKKEQLKEASGILAERLREHLYIVDSRQTTEDIWRTVATKKPALIVVDHLRFVKDKGDNENKRQGAICEALHDLAKAYDLPVLLLVQLNRSVEKMTDKRPQMSDLRDSGEIEETADNVLMLYRDSYYNPPFPPKEKDPTELWIRKFRNGPSGVKIELLFDKSSEWFESVVRK